MKNLLIISFDLVREDECQSFAVGSIVSLLKSKKEYQEDFTLEWYSYNLYSIDKFDMESLLNSELFKKNLNVYTHIAISCYVWCNFIINEFIDHLFKYGFNGKIILGGYEISYSDKEKLKFLYPKADYFISGYAEAALLELITSDLNEKIITKTVNFSDLPSPYITNTLKLYPGISKIRWETKRGCPYQCNFCAHRDLTEKKVHRHLLDKIFEELALFKEYKVKKINVLDPVFNMGKEYINVLKEASRIGLDSLLSLQVRPEHIDDEFLNLILTLNVCLELGIQTMNENENNFIKRKNNFSKLSQALQKLNERSINYEVSLIYGLPFQTVSSFSQSIETLKKLGCKNITAFPLMLLKGTELFDLKDKFEFKEVPMGKYKIPTVVSSNTFTEKEWWQMHEIARQLNPNNRI